MKGTLTIALDVICSQFAISTLRGARRSPLAGACQQNAHYRQRRSQRADVLLSEKESITNLLLYCATFCEDFCEIGREISIMRDTLMLTVPCLGIIVIVYTLYGMGDSRETPDTTIITQPVSEQRYGF